MRILIAGSREITQYGLVDHALHYYTDHLLATRKLKRGEEIEIVAGGARGVDTVARDIATNHGFPYSEFPANWERDGKAAGIIRNAEQGAYCDCGLIIWDGKSRGTDHMRKWLHKNEKPYMLVTVDVHD